MRGGGTCPMNGKRVVIAHQQDCCAAVDDTAGCLQGNGPLSHPHLIQRHGPVSRQSLRQLVTHPINTSSAYQQLQPNPSPPPRLQQSMQPNPSPPPKSQQSIVTESLPTAKIATLSQNRGVAAKPLPNSFGCVFHNSKPFPSCRMYIFVAQFLPFPFQWSLPFPGAVSLSRPYSHLQSSPALATVPALMQSGPVKGRGQGDLVIGDRQIGNKGIALHANLNQKTCK